jgi:hypothetical protein
MTASAEEIYRAALANVAAGISVIPIIADGTKSPSFWSLPRVWSDGQQKYRRTWNPFKERLPDWGEINLWFGSGRGPLTLGLAAVCGAVSGNLEAIDLDNMDLVTPWLTTVARSKPDLLDRLIYVGTPRPGLHAYFRSPCCMPSEKLASTLVIDADTDKEERKTLVETKGEGGYCVIPPTPLGMHLSGRPYVFFEGRDLTNVQMISVEERQILIEAARSLDRLPPRPTRSSSRRRRDLGPIANLPGEDFNLRATWGQILEPRGWELVNGDGIGESQWRRPGKSVGVSATTGVVHGDRLYVFTDNAAPFEMNQSYTKFAAFALLYRGGDFSAAARMLRERGYGRTRGRSAARR